jgi:hypothetical protein
MGSIAWLQRDEEEEGDYPDALSLCTDMTSTNYV